jgi:hypothetical protein
MQILDHLPGDRESESISSTGCTSTISLPESIEYPRKICACYADSSISDLDTCLGDDDIYLSISWSEFLCIRDDIPDRCHEELRIYRLYYMSISLESDTMASMIDVRADEIINIRLCHIPLSTPREK